MELDDILNYLKDGKIAVDEAKKLLSIYAIEEIDNTVKLDLGRKNRRKIPEVIFAEKKQISEIKNIVKRLLQRVDSVLISRIKKEDYATIINYVKKNKLKIKSGKNSTSVLVYRNTLKNNCGKVGILSAGTSDIGIAEEARLMCEAMNCECVCSYDVGIAGLHRLFPVIKKLIESDVNSVIVVAGMEGALASVVSSLVDIPVIGVPTSVGYGYGGKGVSALVSMLQCCSLGLAVVNIDNGIGAGAVASNIANKNSIIR